MSERPTRDDADNSDGADERVLPEQTSDDTDRGWGEDGSDRDSEAEDDERLIREKPPHW